MILTVVIPIIIFIIGIIYAICERDLGLAGIGFLIGLVALVIVFIFVAAASETLPNDVKIYEEEEVPIVALEDNFNLNGHFFLASGIVAEDAYYYYMTKTEEGYKVQKVIASTPVEFSDNPHIVEYIPVGFTEWYYYIFFAPTGTYYKIYIPEGTIKFAFNIDLN